jgi:tellurite resistance protein
MDIAVFSSQELPLVLGVLVTVAAKSEALLPQEYQLLHIINQLHQSCVAVDDLRPIAPSQISEIITAPHQRKYLLQMAMVMAMVDGEIKPHQQKILRLLAQAFCVDEQSLRVMHKAANEHKLLVQFDMIRRLMGKFGGVVDRYARGTGIKKTVFPLLCNGGEDYEVAWRYRQLGLLPAGTLGRTYWEYCIQRHFSFPGESCGLPERMVFHDFSHVLSGYDTDPEGEIQQGAFQAGFIHEDGLMFLLFVILNFHLEIEIAPVANARVRLFEISLLMQALQRGAACKVDLSKNWNFWEVVEVPVRDLRDRYGIPYLYSYGV